MNKLVIQILIEPNHEIPSGVYIDDHFEFHSDNWRHVIPKVLAFKETLIKYGRWVK